MEEKTLGGNYMVIWLLEIPIPNLGQESRKVDLAEVKTCIVEVDKTHSFSVAVGCSGNVGYCELLQRVELSTGCSPAKSLLRVNIFAVQ